ncbi:MAG: NADP-dependent malic enzyme [Deltaproteobacteria bacterium]|jgi:malate dehydrogenase (oxaloacetate-decarboxylating)|nr:NADP-dependent malic enzyme [Deltaproteobacteria bacterium]
MDYLEESLRLHRLWKGKLEVISKTPLQSVKDLSLAYTPGVAAPCLEIQKDPDQAFELTGRWNTVAVVTDGTAVLGLGDIGPVAGLPVMEGKCALFKAFGGVNAIPIVINTKDVKAIVETVSLISGSFGGINLEDISAPRCFSIERELQAKVDIPVFHDDQHGTAVVVLAALENALKIAGKNLSSLKVVITGAGAAGISICKLLHRAGASDIILVDSLGAIFRGREGLNPEKERVLDFTNPRGVQGDLAHVLGGADVFIGVSAPNLVDSKMIKKMAKDPIVFAMANPTPEILPEVALGAGALIVGTGRSDFPNQINNVLAFPGIFRGALDVRARVINEEMNLEAARALAQLIPEPEPQKILPLPFDPQIREAVAEAVKNAARATKVARV